MALDGWPCSLPTSALGLSPLKELRLTEERAPRHSGPWVIAASIPVAPSQHPAPGSCWAWHCSEASRSAGRGGPGGEGLPTSPGGLHFWDFSRCPRASLPSFHSSCFVTRHPGQEARAHKVYKPRTKLVCDAQAQGGLEALCLAPTLRQR